MNTERKAVMSKVSRRPGGGTRSAGRPALLAGLAWACVLAVSLGTAGSGAVLARLTSISTLTAGSAVTVVIEASEPVPYVAAQPDPLTVLVDLRNVSAAGVSSAISRQVGPVADVAVEDARAEDGAAIARVRMSLAQPMKPVVRARRNAVLVEFGGTTAGVTPTQGMAQTASRPTAAPVQKPAPAPAAAVQKPASVPAAPAQDLVTVPPFPKALSLMKAELTPAGGATRLTLTGSDALPEATIEALRHDPPRIVFDLKGVYASNQTIAGPANGPVSRLRIAQFSRDPLVARVVADLRQRVPYSVEQPTGQIAILIGVPGAASASSAAKPAAAKPVPATPRGPAPVVVPAIAAPPADETPTAGDPKPATIAEQKPAVEQKPAEPSAQAADTKTVATGTKPRVSDTKTAAPEAKPVAAEAKPAAQDPEPAEGDTGRQTQISPRAESKVYTGKPVSFDFAGADLRGVLRAFAEPEVSGLNVVIDPSIQGTVDVSLREVPWDQALEIILRANKLGYVIEDNVVRIATLKALAEEESERRKLTDEQALSGQLRVMTRSLSYAKAADMSELLKRTVLTSRGQVEVDARTNTLIMSDLQRALTDAENLINTLDRSEPQVEIEARIVQVTRDSARALGVQWGVNGRMVSELANTSNLKFPAQSSVSGRTGVTQGNSTTASTASTPSMVNLPVTGATSAIGLSMGTMNGSLNLDVALSAIEKKGHGKVLSTPRVMMQNNVEAEMMQGIQIPIQTVSNNTVTVTFKDAALSLRVKPQITASNTVIMDVNLENATPDYSREVNGIPPIDTQRARTQVLVRDGDTTVIGGIVISQETVANDRVPMLHRIPLLGWLFRRDSVEDEGRELLIFITPKIRH